MARVNKLGYVERKSHYPCGSHRNTSKQVIWRDWYLIKQHENVGCLYLTRNIMFPKEYIGKRIRFKVEVLK